MTDAEIDALDGVELRRACAEAVGWEWYQSPFGEFASYAYCHNKKRIYFDATDAPDVSWDDAIAACESAQVRHIELFCGGVPRCRVSVEIGERIEVFVSQGHSPESLCRALLKAIAARDNAT